MSGIGFLKIYFFGTALSLLVALFGLVDSLGGLMYPQGSDWADDSWTEKHSPVFRSRTDANNKRVGSR